MDFGRLSQLIYGALLWWPDQTVSCRVVAPCLLCPPEQVQVFEPILNTATEILISFEAATVIVFAALEPCCVPLRG